MSSSRQKQENDSPSSYISIGSDALIKMMTYLPEESMAHLRATSQRLLATSTSEKYKNIAHQLLEPSPIQTALNPFLSPSGQHLFKQHLNLEEKHPLSIKMHQKDLERLIFIIKKHLKVTKEDTISYGVFYLIYQSIKKRLTYEEIVTHLRRSVTTDNNLLLKQSNDLLLFFIMNQYNLCDTPIHLDENLSIELNSFSVIKYALYAAKMGHFNNFLSILLLFAINESRYHSDISPRLLNIQRQIEDAIKQNTFPAEFTQQFYAFIYNYPHNEEDFLKPEAITWRKNHAKENEILSLKSRELILSIHHTCFREIKYNDKIKEYKKANNSNVGDHLLPFGLPCSLILTLGCVIFSFINPIAGIIFITLGIVGVLATATSMYLSRKYYMNKVQHLNHLANKEAENIADRLHIDPHSNISGAKILELCSRLHKLNRLTIPMLTKLEEFIKGLSSPSDEIKQQIKDYHKNRHTYCKAALEIFDKDPRNKEDRRKAAAQSEAKRSPKDSSTPPQSSLTPAQYDPRLFSGSLGSAASAETPTSELKPAM